ncbi:MAG: prepilin-type N-terminal cleavage/methylation domain-containing protein [Phycisphaerae bacterium]|nr:prepilin-type N-terminal cleavage/methylation domain-containing protein [Phycisphaerae bacterium]
MRPERPRRTGFTLIELLVVVAIIALLISILLPSLSKARAQARATLCASRIGQLCKALLVYTDDYGETPPFMGRGWEDCDSLSDTVWPRNSGITIRQWAYFEDWIMPNMPEFWMDPASRPEDTDLRDGSLFSYARFENLYRCPDFERIASKTQDLFNYTRTMLGRKWYDETDPEGQSNSDFKEGYGGPFGAPGPIMKTSQIYAPGRCYMLMDERWDRHCAAPLAELGGPAGRGMIDGMLSGMWMAMDSCWTIGDEGGQYHGTEKVSNAMPGSLSQLVPPVKQGNAAFYDGHVNLDVDPLPDRNIDASWGIGMVQVASAFWKWLEGMAYTQRGKEFIQISVPL